MIAKTEQKVMKTFVSFEMNFSIVSKRENLLDKELLQFLRKKMHNAGFNIQGPKNREDWAWDFLLERNNYQIESIIGYVNDGAIQWLVTTYLHLSFWKKIFGSKIVKVETNRYLRDYCLAIHQILYFDDRFDSIRWYEQRDFDRNITNKWESFPS